VADLDNEPGFDASGLETRLVALGRSLDLPTPPDLRSAVLARLGTPAGPPPSGHTLFGHGLFGQKSLGRRAVRIAAAAVAALLIVGALTPAGQAAVARVVHAFGVTLRLGSPQAPARPERLPGENATALDQARRQVAFTVVVPPGLGTPDHVTVSDAGRVLSLLYHAGPGRPPAGPGGVSARLDEFDGALDIVFLKQLSAEAHWLSLPNGDPAVWIDTPHDVTYVDRTGTAHTASSHLSGHTLIWSVGGISLRLEGDFSQRTALTVATSTVPTSATTP
jgi:hypothetical protein